MDDREEWRADGEGVFEGKCDGCGRQCLVIHEGCPYTAEIYPERENPESNWCRQCFEAAADDI